MPSPLPDPYFGIPPKEYEQRYFHDMVRSFAIYVQQQRNPGEGRFTTAVYTDLPTSDFGLEPGSLYQQDGFLKVALAYSANPAGEAAASALGDVTVTIT